MKCPGQDMQYWKDDAIFEVNCPKCKAFVEFYKDDTTRKCQSCGHRFVNPRMDFGCAAYCQFADQCIGTLPEEFVMQQDGLFKDKVAVEMKRYFKSDFKRISLSSKLARFAENIAKKTEGANVAIILCAAYLLQIGYTKANSVSTSVQLEDLQKESPPVAEELLEKLGAKNELISQVVTIISGNRPDDSVTAMAYDIVMDAYHLTELERMIKEEGESSLDNLQSPQLSTEHAREEANLLLQQTT